MATGDIGATIDELEFDATKAEYPTIFHVSGDIYAIAYEASDKGNLKTIDIDSVGNIGSVIDTFEINSTYEFTCSVIHISGDVFAIAFTDGFHDGWVKTIPINSVGAIGAVVDSIEFDTSFGSTPDIIHVSGDIYAIAYDGGSVGELKTIDIDTSGNIGSVQDSFVFDSVYCGETCITHISGDIYGIAYVGVLEDGWLKTISIDSAGNIGAAVISSLEFDTTKGLYPEILHVSGDNYVIVYQGTDDDGWMKTVPIDSSGTIGAVISSYEFDTQDSYHPTIISIGDGVFALTYNRALQIGLLRTIPIATNGNISSRIDTYTYETNTCYSPDLIHVSGDIYAIPYRGDDDDGWVETINIETSTPKGGGGSGALIFAEMLM